MHNILNSLRGEAVPEHGVMHGSAIQVLRRTTSARRHVYGSTIRVLSTLVRSRQDGVIALGVGRIYPLPRSPITGTARRATKITLEHRCYSGLGASHLFLAGEADNFLWRYRGGLME
jgi:hypothetical protein